MNKDIIHKAYILYLSGCGENGIVRTRDEYNNIIGIQFLNNSSKDYIVYGYCDSKISYQKQYKNGKRDGDYIEYWDGKILNQYQYKNGKIINE